MVVVAAGAGSRFGGPPKQFRTVAGRPMVAWSIDAALTCSDAVVVVVPSGETPVDGTLDRPGVEVVTGAATRSGSVRAGLAALAGRAADDDIVVIHDAARPLATSQLFGAVVEAVRSGPTPPCRVWPWLTPSSGWRMVGWWKHWTAMN